MTDVLYLLLTLAGFVALALLVGVLDRLVVDADPRHDHLDRPGRER